MTLRRLGTWTRSLRLRPCRSHSKRADFIEIKSVTFCGVSDGSSLTMQNVPWYEVSF